MRLADPARGQAYPQQDTTRQARGAEPVPTTKDFFIEAVYLFLTGTARRARAGP